MFDRPVFYLFAGCIAFGMILCFELGPTGDGVSALAEIATRSDPVPSAPRPPAPRTAELLDAILARPLFNSSRRPEIAAVVAGETDLADKRVTGILIMPGRHIAIFAVKDARSLILGEGETVSGWRIASIAAREVMLSGPAGDKKLRPQPARSLDRPRGIPAVTSVRQPGGLMPPPLLPGNRSRGGVARHSGMKSPG
jgi:hypothetical protein